MNRKYLLDTHILLWYIEDSKKLPQKARTIIDDERNEVYYSIVSIWEAEIKRLKYPDKIISLSIEELITLCRDTGFEKLSLNESHIRMLKTLSRQKDASAHNDPFDRILISQAKSENMIFITHDVLLPDYNENCILCV